MSKKNSRVSGIGKVGSGYRNQVAGSGQLAKGLIQNAASMVTLNPVKMVKSSVKATKNVIKGAGKIGKGIVDYVQGLGQVLFNHPEWYTNYPLDNLVGLNFGKRKDTNDVTIGLLGGISPSATKLGKTTTAASIDIGLVMPKDQNNAFIQSINVLYSKVRAANSGAINYSPENLAAYVMNVRSIRSALCIARRMLASVYYADPYDANAPMLIHDIGTMAECSTASNTVFGVNFYTTAKHAADLQNKLMIWFKRVRSTFPINLPLLDRSDWMFSNIFADSNDKKANYYAFSAHAVPFYTVDGTTITRNDRPLFITDANGNFENNYNAFINAIDSLINDTASSSINTIIAGDILKTFGDSAFYSQSEYPIGATISPIYDESALTQIQNATILGVGVQAGVAESYDFSSGTHTITTGYGLPENRTYNMYKFNMPNRFINAYKDVISPGELISYTRLTSYGTSSNDGRTVDICGTEVALDIAYIDSYVSSKYAFTQDTSAALAVGEGRKNNILAAWPVLDWGPMLLYPYDNSITIALFDFNNYALCSDKDCSIFHQYATMSLLYVGEHIKKQNEFNFVS